MKTEALNAALDAVAQAEAACRKIGTVVAGKNVAGGVCLAAAYSPSAGNALRRWRGRGSDLRGGVGRVFGD